MQNKTNILFVIDGLRGGGKERQLIEIIRNIDKEKFNLGVLTFNDNQHYTKQIVQITDYFRFIKKRPTRLEPFFRIWTSFKDFKPDIVHTWDSLSTFYSFIPCNLLGIPLIDGSIRDAGIDKGIFYHFKKLLLKRAKLVIGNSKAGLLAYKTKGIVLYNVIDTKRFRNPIITSEFNIVMTANFSAYKDQFTFLNAAVTLLQSHIVDQVFLIGDGPLKEKYIQWISKEFPELFSRFHFTGAVFNVEEYLAKCHVGVLCSTPEYSEGLSNSVLEYMAASLVPIVTNLGGSKEIVEDGINGYLIEPKDDKKIVEIIRLLKNSPTIRMHIIEQAKATIENKFSLKKNLDTLSVIYTNLWNKN